MRKGKENERLKVRGRKKHNKDPLIRKNKIKNQVKAITAENEGRIQYESKLGRKDIRT